MFLVPTIPNSPLTSPDARDPMGPMELRRNPALDFIENAAFDSSIAEYDDSYQNSQAHSQAFVSHMRSMHKMLVDAFPAGARMVEVGCGKGDFLEMVQESGHFVVSGYDATYEGDNPAIEKRYLNAGDRISADLVVLRHVLEHIPAPHRFLAMLAEIFGEAKIYIEVPNWDWIAEHQTYFDITYEHVNYFSRLALRKLFEGPVDSGLCFHDQYQYIIAGLRHTSQEFRGQYDTGPWITLSFETLFPNLASSIANVDARLSPQSKLYVWGAATKGCMFLVHCRHQGRLIDRVGFAVDVNPQKCGKYLPGSHVPIKTPDELVAAIRPGDVLLVSNPNYRSEIETFLADRGVVGVDVSSL